MQGADSAAAGSLGLAAALVLGILLLGGGALYMQIGAPGAPDLPMATRLQALAEARDTRPGQAEAETAAADILPLAPPAEAEFLSLMDRLRGAIEERPDDIQGLTLLAQNEARLGNYVAARQAQQQLVAVKGELATPDDRLMLLDMMVFTAGGYVSPEAETQLVRILNADPDNGSARYYAGLLQAQLGRPDIAFPIWRRLLESSPPDAPWVAPIRDQITDLASAAGVRYTPPEIRGPSAADVAAASDMTAEDREEMIRGMVDGLASRLASDGGPPQDWARLISALAVLGETDRARAIADEAEQVFAGNTDALAAIATARAQAGLE